MVAGGTAGQRNPACRAFSALLLGYDPVSRAAHDHWYRRGFHHVRAGQQRLLLGDLLLARGCDGPLLALRGHCLDFPFAHALPPGEPRIMKARTYVLVCAVLVLLTCVTVGASFLPLPE